MNIYHFINVNNWEVTNHIVVANELKTAEILLKSYYTCSDGELDSSYGDVRLNRIVPISDRIASQVIC